MILPYWILFFQLNNKKNPDKFISGFFIQILKFDWIKSKKYLDLKANYHFLPPPKPPEPEPALGLLSPLPLL
jgi:hypothetical protein